MNTMDDARRAKGWLKHCGRAVVVGAGLTGLKTAEALVDLGIEVTVVELSDRVLSTALDETASELVRRAMVEAGVDVLTRMGLVAIESSDDSNDVCAAALNTGERITCEAVFMTIGVQPRIEIVKDSGIDVNRGILVDLRMRTNIKNVYAAGDIAEAFEPLSGVRKVLPVLPNAYIGGRVAGINMSGGSAQYSAGLSVNSVNFFGMPFMSAGFSTQSEEEGFKVFRQSVTNARCLPIRKYWPMQST